MSSESQPNSGIIFKKSNIFYIPLSITIAHTLNFISNSSSSTWKEFPPKLPSSVHSSIFFTPLLLFILLTFKPIQTRTRFYTLLSLTLIFSSIPLIYRENKFPNNFFVSVIVFLGLKMLLFLKINRTYLNVDQKKEFTPFFWTLFNWRLNSYIIPPKKSKDLGEEENPLIIKSPTTSQINKKLINRFVIIIAKVLTFELGLFILIKSFSDITTKAPTDKAYQIRLMEFITKGIPPITIPQILQNLNAIAVAYLCLSLGYDITTLIIAIFYRLFVHSTSEKSNYKPILIKSGILNVSEYVSLKEWTVSLLFNTKHYFSEPIISSSPRDFWSNRWQLLFSEVFKELGYLPVKNLISPYVPRKIANMMGVLGAFCVSGLLHEYIIIGQLDLWTGENFFFFMSHGVLLILWEVIFGYEDKIKITNIRRILKWLLLLTINLLLLPALLEPSMSNFEPSEISSFFSKYYINQQI